MKILTKHALDHFFLAGAEQAVVNKNAGELISDRFVQKRGGDRGIDPAAQAQNDFGLANLPSNAVARFFDERSHRPIHGAATDMIGEILEDLFASRGMGHFRMELQAVKLSPGIFHRGEIATLSSRRHLEAFRQLRYFIAMAVPNIESRAETFE